MLYTEDEDANVDRINIFKKIDSVKTKDISQPNPVITADVGDHVVLRCFRREGDDSGAIVWYKQKVGHDPCVMVTVQHDEPSYEDEFKPPKFSIKKEKMNFLLKIANLERSDEAMYYCAVRNFLTKFRNGTFLSVKGKPDLSVSVSQISVLDSVPAGASVTLQCSVLFESRAAELQVLWFRAPPQSHPQIIYTHHNSSHQCESASSTHTCVYTFSKNILSLNDTGTYYCAVAACGKIIFGSGTRVQLKRAVDPVVIYLAVALGVCVLVILALIFIITCKGMNWEQHMVRQGSVSDKALNQDCDNVELNYAALHFNKRKGKRGRVKKQPQDIIYSDVRYLSRT